jgi:hypothetical protein
VHSFGRGPCIWGRRRSDDESVAGKNARSSTAHEGTHVIPTFLPFAARQRTGPELPMLGGKLLGRRADRGQVGHVDRQSADTVSEILKSVADTE